MIGCVAMIGGGAMIGGVATVAMITGGGPLTRGVAMITGGVATVAMIGGGIQASSRNSSSSEASSSEVALGCGALLGRSRCEVVAMVARKWLASIENGPKLIAARGYDFGGLAECDSESEELLSRGKGNAGCLGTQAAFGGLASR